MSTEVLFSRLKYFFQLANANFRIKTKQFGQSTSICEFKEEFKKENVFKSWKIAIFSFTWWEKSTDAIKSVFQENL